MPGIGQAFGAYLPFFFIYLAFLVPLFRSLDSKWYHAIWLAALLSVFPCIMNAPDLSGWLRKIEIERPIIIGSVVGSWGAGMLFVGVLIDRKFPDPILLNGRVFGMIAFAPFISVVLLPLLSVVVVICARRRKQMLKPLQILEADDAAREAGKQAGEDPSLEPEQMARRQPADGLPETHKIRGVFLTPLFLLSVGTGAGYFIISPIQNLPFVYAWKALALVILIASIANFIYEGPFSLLRISRRGFDYSFWWVRRSLSWNDVGPFTFDWKSGRICFENNSTTKLRKFTYNFRSAPLSERGARLDMLPGRYGLSAGQLVAILESYRKRAPKMEPTAG